VRINLVGLLSGSVVLCGGRFAWAQAGRPIPIPRVIPGGGGAGHLPHIHIPFLGQDSDLCTGFFLGIGLLAALAGLAWVGFHLGYALGGGKWPTRPQGGWQAQDPAWFVPEQPDLILNAAEVAEKAAQTTLLMEFLAHRDPQLDPASLRQTVTDTFCRVQHCWEARDYGPVSDLLRPGILAEHQELLRQMREVGAINRIEGLQVKAVDFVRLFCPEDPDAWEVAALITFEAVVYFVNDRDGAHTRGSRSPRLFQEFWVFRRQGESWLLDAIKRSHESDLLQTANHVAGLSAEQLQNMQQSIAL
jgi:hypothetical protein